MTNITITVDGNLTNVNFWVNNGANSGVAQVTAFAPDVIRVRYYFTALWTKEEPMIAKPTNQWATVTGTAYNNLANTYEITTPQLKVVVTKTPNFKIDFQDLSGYTLSQDDKIQFDPAYSYTGQSGWQSNGYKLKSTKVMPAGQAYFGLGENGGPLNRRGRELECWNSGTYKWGEFQNPTYLNIPFFYGVQPASGNIPAFVYGMFFNNPCRPLFSFGQSKSGADRFSFEAGDGQMDYFFFGGGANHTMAGVIDRFSELTGRPTFLPKWAFGHQLSRFSYDSQSWVEYIANQATVEDIPLDAVHMDIDYMQYGFLGDGNIRQLTVRPSTFANPAGMLSYCNARGVKVIPLIEPWLEPGDTTLYNDANANFHFIKENN
ncbi:MAG: TIM-barrel domain-containing protein, partial [Verrucomicrobiota bacterium]